MRCLLLLLLVGCTTPTFFADRELDADGDTFLPEQGDCDDRQPAAHPDHPEICDGIDNDCDGAVDGDDSDLGDQDADGVDACSDCDDGDARRTPGAEEACDGVDSDCDGQPAEDEVDEDGDKVLLCAGDCNDDDPNVAPGLPEACDGLDTDCDGFGEDDDPDVADLDGDGVRACADCDDLNAAVLPGAFEVCDGEDTDCSGGPASDEVDEDGDEVLLCAGDCDDGDPQRFPDADERCNGVDDDCDGSVPQSEEDNDSDGDAACSGDCDDDDANRSPQRAEACDGEDTNCDGLVPSSELDSDGDGAAPCSGDCDDGDATIGPGAVELCDGVDSDCVGGPGPDESDDDGDGVRPCEGDCDDLSAAISPAQAEACDGEDTDCDGIVPEDEQDADLDGSATCDGDCDDSDASRTPAAAEVCDGLDTNCDGLVPPDELDADGDGAAQCDGDCNDGDDQEGPEAAELCDGVDNDCDGNVDGADSDAVDADGDGSSACDDCDDASPLASPLRPESCGDGEDNDCDGFIDEASSPAPPWVVAGTAFSGQSLFWPVGSGGVPSTSPLRDGPTPSSGEFVPRLAADFDGDGSVEVLLEQVDPADTAADEVVLFGFDCSGSPSSLLSSGLELPGTHQVVAVGDLDNDGLPDLVTRDDGGVLRSLLNIGGRVFAGGDADASVDPGAWIASTAADIDGDGLLDLLACRATAGTVCEVFGGEGDGTFTAAGLLLETDQLLGAPAWVDLNGDGALDVAVAARAGGDPGAVHVFLGDGTGSVLAGSEALDVDFSEEAGAGDSTLVATELDGGDADLILLVAPVSGERARELHALLGDGAGGLSIAGPPSTFQTASALLGDSGGVAASPP